MNLTEVIAALQELILEHPDCAGFEVLTEGCDCFNEVHHVDMDSTNVLLLRSLPAPTLPPTKVQGLPTRPKEVKIWPHQG